MKLMTRMLGKSSGHVLPMALVLLFMGGLFVAPVLVLMTTSLKANMMAEENTSELYAADAGVEYGLWWIKDDVENNQGLGLPAEGEELSPSLPQTTINDVSVDVTVSREADEEGYWVTSAAGNTTIQSYVELLPGENLGIFSCGLASETDITFGKTCTVTGDIYYGGSFIHPTDFTHVEGDEICGGWEWPVEEQVQEFAETYIDEASAGGTWEGDYAIGIGDGVTVTELGPLYINGNLSIQRDNIIDLQGTIYVNGWIDVDMDSEFTGSGSIVAVGDIWLAKLSSYGTEGSCVIMSVTGDITFKKEATVEALIFAPEGKVDFCKGADVTGGIIASEVEAGKEGTFVFDAEYDESIEFPGYAPGGWVVTSYAIQ